MRCRFSLLVLLLVHEASGGGAHRPATDRNLGSGPRLQVVNGLSHDLSTLYAGSPPGVDPTRPGTGLLGVPGWVRVRDDLLWVVLSRPDAAGSGSFRGGLTLLDRSEGWTLAFRDLDGFTNNPWDIAFTQLGFALLSNLLPFDPAGSDYRLTVLDLATLEPVAWIHLPNPFAGGPDPSLSPSGMTVAGDLLFVCCTGFSFSSYDYPNPGTVAVLDVRTGKFVDTDADPGNGITPLFTSRPNPGVAAVGPDGDLYVLCGGNYGVFAGLPHTPGGVDVYSLPGLAHEAFIDFGGLSAPASMQFTPDLRGYVGDGVEPLVYSFDVTTDTVLRTWNDAIQLPRSQPYGYIADFAFLEDLSVIAIDFNADAASTWPLAADLNAGDPGVAPYADLDPHASGLVGPQWLIPVRDR